MTQRHKDTRTKGMKDWPEVGMVQQRGRKECQGYQSLQEEAYVFLELSWAADAADNLILNIYPAGL